MRVLTGRRKLLRYWVAHFDGEVFTALDKSILLQYMDAETLIEHTERQLRRLRMEREAVLTDTVKGSNPNYPYEEVTFRIEGLGNFNYTDKQILDLEHSLDQRRLEAAKLRIETEEWVNTLPPRLQLIVQIKFLGHGTWEEVARKIGHGSTSEGLRKEYERYMSIKSEKCEEK